MAESFARRDVGPRDALRAFGRARAARRAVPLARRSAPLRRAARDAEPQGRASAPTGASAASRSSRSRRTRRTRSSSSPPRRWLAEARALRARLSLQRRRGDGAAHRRGVRRRRRRARPRSCSSLGDVEFYLGALGFRDIARRRRASRCACPSSSTRSEPRVARGLFNPLLLAHGMKPVPCDISTDRHDATCSSPGRTRAARRACSSRLALAQLLAQCGALRSGARGDDRRSRRRSSCRSSKRRRPIKPRGGSGRSSSAFASSSSSSPPGAMVILDELCSGTNPSEGEEIFELVVRMLDAPAAAGVHHDALPRVRGAARAGEEDRRTSLPAGRARAQPRADVPVRAGRRDDVARRTGRGAPRRDGRPAPRAHRAQHPRLEARKRRRVTTFLANRKMSPGLRERVETSVRGRRGRDARPSGSARS